MLRADLKKSLWDKLSDTEIRQRIEDLPHDWQDKIFEFFRFSQDELLALGWLKICLGCRGPYQNCDCPCGSGMVPPYTISG